jgi:hypothetical protein
MYFPALHNTQSDRESWRDAAVAGSALYLPAGQMSQDTWREASVDASERYFPLEHAEQKLEPVLDVYEPAPHVVQSAGES